VQDKAGLYIFLVFGFVMTYIALQFWFITKDCYVNNYIALSIAIISWLCVFFWLPESPRFLYSRKQFAKAQAALDNAGSTINVILMDDMFRDAEIIEEGEALESDYPQWAR